jgi:mannitol 2-dehydrogenase
MTDIYGDLARQPSFVAAFSHALTTLWSIGTRATLERYLADSL